MSSIEGITNVRVLRDDTAAARANLNDPIDPATSCLMGSFTYDRENGFNLEWDSIEAFRDWFDKEQMAQAIELKLSKTTHVSALFTTSRTFRCTRKGTGGSKYQRKTTREQRMESKRIAGGCPCVVQIKMYPHTGTVLGKYNLNHSHPSGWRI